MSHELRTPLTSIRSFSEILLDAPDLSEEERTQFLGIVIRESERLTRLINDVLDLSKIESGRMEWHVTDCDLRDILQDSVAASKGLLAEKTALAEIALAPDAAPIRCDRDRLIQVVINLISNACKFVPDHGGRVRLVLDETDSGWMVKVEDNGPGVPPEWRETIFEKFRQVADDLKSRPKGSGLGLTICRQIVEHFGGRIWVEDAHDLSGAAICFTLPAAGVAEMPTMAAE